MTDILADSFELIPATAEVLRLLVAGQYSAAGKLLGVIVPEGWPNDPEATDGLAWHLRALERNSQEFLWRVRLIVLSSTRTVVGSINLKGQPDKSGTVEIGWGVSLEFRRRGIATRAATAVMEWSFAQPGVKRIIATIAPENTASQRIAERLGMRLTAQQRRALPVWAKEKTDSAKDA